MVLGEAVSTVTNMPRAPHSLESSILPAAAASPARSRWQQHLNQANCLISVVTLLNQSSPGCFCISCWNKGWR